MKKDTRDLTKYRQAVLSVERGISIERNAPLKVCLVFPNTYHAGMSNLAVHTLYSILNAREDCVCERSFCEEPLMGRSLESGRWLNEFHIIAFSISFELDYPNVLRTLLAARIPLKSADRKDTHPLVIAGGPCVFSNPEPLADYVDIYAVGDGEEMINEIVDGFARANNRGLGRASALSGLSVIKGVYAPSCHTPVYSSDSELIAMETKNQDRLPVLARVVSDLDNHPCCSVIMTPRTEFAKMFLIELGRGCRRGCRFCSASHTQLRRNRTLHSIEKQIIAAEKVSDRVGLVTSDLADYPQREELIKLILNRGMGLSVSSVRADAITDDLLAGMRMSGQRTLTLAPEIATEKLAAFAGKRITADMLLGAVDRALSHHIINFRLYFIIGFPGEEDDDVEAIVRLAARVHETIKQAARSLRKIGKLTISVNPFIPKPFTPLESAPFADRVVLSRRFKILRQGITRLGNTRLAMESARMARLQCVFSRGDRRVGRVIELLARGTTASQAMRTLGSDIERYLCPQTRDTQFLPWHTIEPPAANIKKTRREQLN